MNIYTLLDGRLVADPETIKLRDNKSMVKIRLADNPGGKKDDKRPARFVNGKAFGAQGEALARLSKGDVITVSGDLGVEAYEAKDGTQKTADVLIINRFRVQKSESFFAPKEGVPKGDEALDDLFGAP